MTRTRARITVHDGREICRLDVARSPRPVWATTSTGERLFFVRMNNPTRSVPADEMAAYPSDRFPDC